MIRYRNAKVLMHVVYISLEGNFRLAQEALQNDFFKGALLQLRELGDYPSKQVSFSQVSWSRKFHNCIFLHRYIEMDTKKKIEAGSLYFGEPKEGILDVFQKSETKRIGDVIDWFKENKIYPNQLKKIKPRGYKFHRYTFVFEKPSDAMLFKLAWG